MHGYVTPRRAREGYGVVVDEDGKLDRAATRKLRKRMDGARFRVRVIANDEREAYVGVKGRRRVLDLTPAMAKRLGLSEDDLLEIAGNNPAPLRAWARIAEDAPPDGVWLDDFARKVLGVAEGERVILRPLPMPHIQGGMAR